MPAELLNRDHIKILSIACFIVAVCFFDFAVFLYLSDILVPVFFGDAESTLPFSSQLSIILLVGYFARPLGGLLIGSWGDKYGRKQALAFSVFGLAIFTLTIAILPTYQQIGVFSKLLFMCVYFGQGLCIGGVIPSAWVYVSEQTPTKHLGLFNSIITASYLFPPVCLMLLSYWLYNTLHISTLLSDGWRLPFIAGGSISLLLLLLLTFLKETPIFIKAQIKANETSAEILAISLSDGDDAKTHEVSSKSLKSEHRDSSNRLIQITKEAASFVISLFNLRRMFSTIPAITLCFIIVVLILFPSTLFTSLMESHFSLTESQLKFGMLVTLISMIIGCVFYGSMVDRFNPGNVIILGSLFLGVQALWFMDYLPANSDIILAIFVIFGLALGVVGAIPSVVVRLFPTSNRLRSIGFLHNLMAATVGVSLPIILGYSSFYVALAPILLIAIVSILLIFIGFFVYYIPRTEFDLQR